MSQEQLAERSGVARDTISKLETGRRKAYPVTIRKLAAGLEVAPGMLLGDVGEYPDDDVGGRKGRRSLGRARGSVSDVPGETLGHLFRRKV